MAAKIKAEFGVESTLKKSDSTGAFEVYKNDKLVYSKLQTGNFPAEAELLKLLKAQ